MRTDIRLASSGDAQLVASFFSDVYETQHGIGSAGSLEMLQRTVASLFSDDEAPTVFISEADGVVLGVAAVKQAMGSAVCELIAIQTNDSVHGRGVAQTLLRTVVEYCAARGGSTLVTTVPSSDVRARGFLRREGFVASAEELATGSQAITSDVVYTLDVVAIATRAMLPDTDPEAPADS